jgi:chromosome segregation ATPase
MNRILAWINLGGVLVLAGLCVFQWRANRDLNLQVNALETTRLAQSAKLDEQSEKLRGLAADLDRFREQLAATTLAKNDMEEKLRASERLAARLTGQRDQLKAAIVQWTAAVTTRDDRLREANISITDLGARLNDTIAKYNALAATHNVLVKQVNEARAAAAGAQK